MTRTAMTTDTVTRTPVTPENLQGPLPETVTGVRPPICTSTHGTRVGEVTGRRNGSRQGSQLVEGTTGHSRGVSGRGDSGARKPPVVLGLLVGEGRPRAGVSRRRPGRAGVTNAGGRGPERGPSPPGPRERPKKRLTVPRVPGEPPLEGTRREDSPAPG